jgi:hypothetical protein
MRKGFGRRPSATARMMVFGDLPKICAIPSLQLVQPGHRPDGQEPQEITQCLLINRHHLLLLASPGSPPRAAGLTQIQTPVQRMVSNSSDARAASEKVDMSDGGIYLKGSALPVTIDGPISHGRILCAPPRTKRASCQPGHVNRAQELLTIKAAFRILFPQFGIAPGAINSEDLPCGQNRSAPWHSQRTCPI